MTRAIKPWRGAASSRIVGETSANPPMLLAHSAVLASAMLHVRAPPRGHAPHMGASATWAPADGPLSTAIVGAGPAGLSTAIMLARRGWKNIHVYDKLAAPADPDDKSVWSDAAKFYLIGLGGRGQNSLKSLGVWDEVERRAQYVVGRKDWAPGAGADEGIERIFEINKDRSYKTAVIARDRLVGVLEKTVAAEYSHAVTVHSEVECAGVEWGSTSGGSSTAATLTLRGCAPTSADPVEAQRAKAPRTVTAELVIGADGAARYMANAMEEQSRTDSSVGRRKVRVTRYTDDNERVYKTVPMRLPEGWRPDINYSARSADGRVIFDALPASGSGEYCGVLLLKADDEFAQPRSDATGLRALLEESLPQFSPLVSDDAVAAVAAKPPSSLPSFRYVGPSVHLDDGSSVRSER